MSIPWQGEMGQPRFEQFAYATEAHTQVPIDLIFGKKRSPRYVAARRALVWALLTDGWSNAAVGRMLGYDHTSVLHWAKTVTPADKKLAAKILKDGKKAPPDEYPSCGAIDMGHPTGELGVGCARPPGHRGQHAVPLAWHEWSTPMPK